MSDRLTQSSAATDVKPASANSTRLPAVGGTQSSAESPAPSRNVPPNCVAAITMSGVARSERVTSISTANERLPPSAIDFSLLMLLGLVAMVAFLCVNRSLKLAPASVVVPYQYTMIVWAVALGWPVFGDVPDAFTIAGAAIIIAAGLYILWREQIVARREPTFAEPP